MATFGVLDDVKLGLHNTFEKMRFKFQKSSAKMSIMSSSNDHNNNNNSGNHHRGVYDYYSPISQIEAAPLDDNNNNKSRRRADERMTISSSSSNGNGNGDIGLLPLERESSCLQDVLEGAGNCSSKSKEQQQQSERNLVSKEVSSCSSKNSTTTTRRRTSAEDACLVDLDYHEANCPALVAPPAGPARSLSAFQPPAPPPSSSSFQSLNIHRSASLSTASPATEQHQDLFDVFSSSSHHQKNNNNDFATFFTKNEQATITLKPTPIGGGSFTNLSLEKDQDPFASIIFGDFQPQQSSQNVPKQKVTLGELASSGNNLLPAGFISPPTSSSFTHPTNNSAPQLIVDRSRASSMQNNNNVGSSNLSQVPVIITNNASSSSTSSNQNNLDNLFDDVFDRLGFTKQATISGERNQTMRQMRQKEALLARELADDPEALKVRQWVDGKQGNIRALLSTLEQILWDDESRSRWEPIPIHQLVRAADVRRAYKRAVVVCHPDKLVGTSYERISRLVFVELNEASSEFQQKELLLVEQ